MIKNLLIKLLIFCIQNLYEVPLEKKVKKLKKAKKV